jgi:hypothetical protein
VPPDIVPLGSWTTWQHPTLGGCIAVNNCSIFRNSGGVFPTDFKVYGLLAITRTMDAVLDGRELGGEEPTVVQTFTPPPGEYGPLRAIYLSEQAYLNLVGPVTETITRGRTGTISAPDKTTTYTVPGDQGTATDAQEATEPFNDQCGQAFINWWMEPGNYPIPSPGCFTEPEPAPGPGAALIELLQPLVGETYANYLARLQAQGYVGTATRTHLSESAGDPAMGPNGIARLRVQSRTGTVNVYRPSAWPSTGVEISADSDLDIATNPDSYTEGGTTPGTPLPPVGGGGGTCDGYMTAAVDLTPLTQLNFGNKFPFGLFGWFADIIDQIVAAPDAPSWSFDFDWLNIDADYVVDLEAFDPYMERIRTLLSWVMWAGAIWFAATSLLGIRNTGDPGAAVDDAW